MKQFLLLMTIALLFGCSKGETPDPISTKVIPTVSTTAVTSITQNNATSGGNITSDGGATVTVRGVCWGTNNNPTTSDNKTSDGLGIGGYSSLITGLIPNTIYYVRAYATNSIGTGYGEEVFLKTLAITVNDIDGNVYNTIIIGTQVWLVENLKTTKYRNGDPIPNVTSNSAWSILTTGAYCNYNNDSNNSTIYGRLYNWYAVTDSRNVCPSGWHVATYDDWTALTTYLGGMSVAGGKLKETGTSHWVTPNSGATNETGFKALGGGFCGYNGLFADIGNRGIWWSCDGGVVILDWYMFMSFDDSRVGSDNTRKNSGLSARCIKD
ncbi:MAG: fibrobacter succinogenes major paralogous domain-containing protein [Rikenellaceae bacterium]